MTTGRKIVKNAWKLAEIEKNEENGLVVESEEYTNRRARTAEKARYADRKPRQIGALSQKGAYRNSVSEIQTGRSLFFFFQQARFNQWKKWRHQKIDTEEWKGGISTREHNESKTGIISWEC